MDTSPKWNQNPLSNQFETLNRVIIKLLKIQIYVKLLRLKKQLPKVNT